MYSGLLYFSETESENKNRIRNQIKLGKLPKTEPNESEICERTLKRVKVVSKLAQNEQVMTAV